MFEAMNARIEYLFDKDHALGHSMFLGLRREPTLTNLAKIFRNSIIPLLEEYFHEDWSRIQLVLGDHPDQRFKSNGDKLVKDEVRIPDSVF